MARRVVGAVVLLLALSGCGGDPKADPPPAPSTSPVSTTPSATTSAPAMPDAAKENSKAGAIAFVRHYIDLINYAQATGDVGPLAAVENAGCTSCTKGRDALAAIYRDGGSIEGGQLTFHATSSAPNSRYKGWLISGVLRFAPETVTWKKGEGPEQLGGGSTPVNALVTMNNESRDWRVMEWTRGS